MSTYVANRDIFEPAMCAELLEYGLASEHLFTTTSVGVDGNVRKAIRQSRRLTELGAFESRVEERAFAQVPSLIRQLGLTTFTPAGIELELVAHEHGAFYRRHIDLFTHAERHKAAGDRMISLVAYMFRQPKSFDGGELRLFTDIVPAAPGADERYVDIVPEDRMTVAFSSWLPHEVRPVDCPSQQFQDARFALNCWIYRAR